MKILIATTGVDSMIAQVPSACALFIYFIILHKLLSVFNFIICTVPHAVEYSR